MREDGYVFRCLGKDGYAQWDSPETAHRQRLWSACSNAKRRAASSGVPFDIDVDHLQEIFPKDWRCPILGIKLEWGERGGLNSSPSLDRKDPNLGYIKGNVAFISQRANRLKQDASLEELERILSYLRN